MPNKKLLTDIYSSKKPVFSEQKVIKNKSPFSFKKGLFFLLIFLFLSGSFYFFDLAKARIEIEPRTEFSSLSGEVKVPINFYQKEKTVSETFSSSGKILAEEKAKGTIKVYNEYSTSPQTLIATTRFVSSEDGKVFRTPVAVTIPGGRYEGRKFIAGEIDIEVVADQPGEDYNIGPSTFSIPGFLGTDRYTKFYAESFQSMEGGFLEEIPEVTEADLVEAENQLVDRAIKECLDQLEEDIQSEAFSAKYYCLSDDFASQIIEKVPLALVGEKKEEFKFQVKANCQAELVEKEIINEMARGMIVNNQLDKISADKTERAFIFVPDKFSLVESSLEVDYSLNNLDADLEEATLSLDASARVYPEIDFYNLKNSLLNKSPLEAEMFLQSQPEIINANVSLSPFWVKKIPSESNRIEVELNVD